MGIYKLEIFPMKKKNTENESFAKHAYIVDIEKVANIIHICKKKKVNIVQILQMCTKFVIFYVSIV